VKFKPVQSPR